MPICVFLEDFEIRLMGQTLEDQEIKDILAQVNNLLGKKWLVQTIKVERARWRRKAQKSTFYTVFAHVDGPEWEVVNFAPDGTSSINTVVPKSDVLNYLMNILVGWKQ